MERKTDIKLVVEMNRIAIVQRKVDAVKKSTEFIKLLLAEDASGQAFEQSLTSLNRVLDAMIESRLKVVRGESQTEAA